MSNTCNPVLPLMVVKQHTKFEEISVMLSQVIIQKPKSFKNESMASLKNRSRLTKYHCILASKVMKQHHPGVSLATAIFSQQIIFVYKKNPVIVWSESHYGSPYFIGNKLWIAHICFTRATDLVQKVATSTAVYSKCVTISSFL